MTMTQAKTTYTIAPANSSDYPFVVKDIASGRSLSFKTFGDAEAWIGLKTTGGCSYDQFGNRIGRRPTPQIPMETLL